MRKIMAIGFLAWAGAPSAQTIIQMPDSLWSAGDTVAWVKKIPTFCEGPVWEPSTGSVYFTRQYGNSTTHWPVYRVRPGVDTGAVFIAQPRQANGLAFDPQGRLVAAQNQRLTRYKADGSEDSVLVTSGTNSVTFNLANDLSIGSSGGIYFTANGSQIFYLSPSRQLSIAFSGATSANGIEWVEEDTAVYVNEGRLIKKYMVGSNGALTFQKNFAAVVASGSGTYADGGTIDSHGNRYIASFQLGDLRVFNAKGDSIGRIALRQVSGSYDALISGATANISNAVFGGPDMKTLYMTGDGGLFAIRLKVPGREPSLPPVALRPAIPGQKFAPAAATEFRDLRGRLLPSDAPAAAPRVPATPRGR